MIVLKYLHLKKVNHKYMYVHTQESYIRDFLRTLYTLEVYIYNIHYVIVNAVMWKGIRLTLPDTLIRVLKISQ